MIRRHWLTWVLVGVLILIVGIGLLVKFGIEKVRAEEILAKFPDRGIPRMNITLNGISLEEINGGSKDEKYEGNGLTVYDGRNDVAEYAGVRVKGRGNGTWAQEKKPYQIKFENKVDLFEMGKARKWVLLANATDATNLRTATAFYLEKMLGMEPAFDGRFVELYVDGEYEGLYYLTHALEIGKASVDLKDPMGVLVELDNVYGWSEKYYKTGNGDRLVAKDAVVTDMAEKGMEEFLRDYIAFEKAVKEKNYKKVCELVNVKSFAQYYLLSEFTVNPDAYWTSFYMYRDGANDKIHAGPGWDFDMAFANKAWGNWLGEEFYSPLNTMVRKRELITKEAYEDMGLMIDGGINWYDVSLDISRILFDLMEIPEFREEVQRVYLEKMEGRKKEMILEIGRGAGSIADAAFADEERWRSDGFWQEVRRMKKWVSERYDYFDKVYGGEMVLVNE